MYAMFNNDIDRSLSCIWRDMIRLDINQNYDQNAKNLKLLSKIIAYMVSALIILSSGDKKHFMPILNIHSCQEEKLYKSLNKIASPRGKTEFDPHISIRTRQPKK